LPRGILRLRWVWDHIDALMVLLTLARSDLPTAGISPL
jgi:hypothetical protein